jgi:hypothetical protein
VVRVLTPLVRSVLNLPEYTRRTSALDEEAKAVRDALSRATEPDVLLFSALPNAVGMSAFTPAGQVTFEKAARYADRVMDALARLENLYSALIDSIVNALAMGFGRSAPARLDEVRAEVSLRSAGLVDKVLEPRLRSFLLAAADSHLDDQDWVENLAMNVAERPPRAWRDEDRQRFEVGLDELLRAFRRVEILHLEHLDAHPNGARARQVVVTTPEGKVTESIVWLDDAAAEAVEGLVATALKGASLLVGARAPETLLAVLAERLIDAGTLELSDRSESSVRDWRRQHA